MGQHAKDHNDHSKGHSMFNKDGLHSLHYGAGITNNGLKKLVHSQNALSQQLELGALDPSHAAHNAQQIQVCR